MNPTNHPISLPFRQVHLDFHTSEALEDIGAHFDPDQFAATLQQARVNSINLFARCHHGWLYYQSPRFPELVHPHLGGRNLLREQMDACRKAGIRATVYITVQFDHKVATEHPEWLVMDETGALSGPGPYEASFYRFLAVNTGYGDYLRDIVTEVMEQFPDTAGVFFDITMPQICSNPVSLRQMAAEGRNPADRGERKAFGVEVINRFKQDLSTHVRSFKPDCAIVYNAGHVGARHRAVADAYSHFEVESLGSGQWGYAHFSVTARYVRTLGKPFVGMTGKFHTEWGDFHSFKPQAALEFEVFRMLAVGGTCCVGDQLHPSGSMCAATYDLIGSVYRQVEALEPWCQNARPVTELAILNPESCGFPEEIVSDIEMAELHVDGGLSGCVRLLEEGGFQFDVIDRAADFPAYALLVLPDGICCDPELTDKLRAYVAQGGKILASFESGLDVDRQAFPEDLWPVRLTGHGPRDAKGARAAGRFYEDNAFIEYLLPGERMGANLPPVEHVLYSCGLEIEARKGSAVLAESARAYFDRNWKHFCSHRQTPSSGTRGAPAAVRNQQVLYFRHPLFAIYHEKAPLWVREMIHDGVREMIGPPVVEHDGPRSLGVTLNYQEAEQRYVMHLLHYLPVRKAADLEIIENRQHTGPVNLQLRIPEKVQSIRCITEPDQELQWGQTTSGKTELYLNNLHGHAVIELAVG